MNIHILTPFYRKKLARTLIYYWRQQNVKWYPLIAPKDYMEFNEDWVLPIKVNELELGSHVTGELTCFDKIEEFRNTQQQTIIDEDYYGVTCDETVYEPGFMDILKQQTAKVVICSAYRGNKTPGSDPTKVKWYRYMNPPPVCVVKHVTQIKRNYIGMGQYFVKGEIFKHLPYVEWSAKGFTRCDDGHYIVELRERYPNDITILTDWYSFSNYLQPGRWTTTTNCIKPNWELPKYIGIDDIEKEKDTLHEELKDGGCNNDNL